MKRFATCILSVSALLPAAAQDNFVVQRRMLAPNGSQHIDRIDLYDGLGRKNATALYRQAQSEANVVTLTEIDALGRQTKQWHPVARQNSEHINADIVEALAQSQYSDSRAFTELTYTAALDKADTLTRAGEQLASHHRTFRRLINTTEGMLSCYDLQFNDNGSFSNNGILPAGSLFVDEAVDEDGRTSLTFFDSHGIRILSRNIITAESFSDTYEIRDDYGDLRYVVPPEAAGKIASNETCGRSWTIDNDTIKQYCYYYERDVLGNITLKKLPGQDAIEYRYDALNRLTLWRDGNMRNTGVWAFVFYDHLMRPAVEGTVGILDNEVEGTLKEGHVARFTGKSADWETGYYAIDGSTVFPTAATTVEVVHF